MKTFFFQTNKHIAHKAIDEKTSTSKALIAGSEKVSISTYRFSHMKN